MKHIGEGGGDVLALLSVPINTILVRHQDSSLLTTCLDPGHHLARIKDQEYEIEVQ